MLLFGHVGNAEGKFAVDSATGVLIVSAELDFESTPAYTLEISAVDSGGSAAVVPATITVTILNENDNVPECNQAAYTGSVVENSANNVVVRAPRYVLSYYLLSGIILQLLYRPI